MAILEVDGLTRRFGDRTAVDHLSFAVEPGEAVGLLGPDEAGKSTTLKMLVPVGRAPGTGCRSGERR